MVMNVLFPGINTIVADVVFVHGLKGDVLLTWQSPSTNNVWPRDLLPFNPSLDANSSIRVLSFSYSDAPNDFFPSNASSNNTVDDISDNLLVDLSSKRNNPDATSRPIIFVGHSVGGIIVKNALNKAHSYATNGTSSDLATIGKVTIGALFLGTPQKGGNPTIWTDIVARLSRLPNLGYSPLTTLVLTAGSPALARIEADFMTGVIDGLQIFSFYEQLKSTMIAPLPSEIVVDRANATIGHKNERQLSLPRDHYGIAWADSDTDPGYQRLADSIFRVLKNYQQGSTPNIPGIPLGLSVDQLRKLRDGAFKTSQFSTALNYNNQLVAALTSTQGATARETLKEQMQSAAINVWLRDFPSAAKIYNQVYQAQQIAFGPSDSDTLATAQAIGSLGAWQNNS